MADDYRPGPAVRRLVETAEAEGAEIEAAEARLEREEGLHSLEGSDHWWWWIVGVPTIVAVAAAVAVRALT